MNAKFEFLSYLLYTFNCIKTPNVIISIMTSKNIKIDANANKQKFTWLMPHAKIAIDINKLNYYKRNNSTIPKNTPKDKTIQSDF